MKLSEIPDSILAGMIRDGCYTKNVNMGPGDHQSRFLLVFAIPYGPEDSVETLREAFESFHEFNSDNDWEERNIQVLMVESSGVVVHEVSAEVLEG